jgi:hypothetical protein
MKSCWGGAACPQTPRLHPHVYAYSLAVHIYFLHVNTLNEFLRAVHFSFYFLFVSQLSTLNEILLRGCAPPPRPPACSCVFMHTHWQLTFILTLQYSQWNPYIFYALPLEFNCLYYIIGQHVWILDGIDSVLLHFTYHILATYPSWPTVRSLPQPWVQPAIHSEKVFLLLSGTFWRHNSFLFMDP